MGICESSSTSTEDRAKQRAEKAKSRQLDTKIDSDQNQDLQISKLLLLGAGESGKSTLFKQMKTIYGTGYAQEELQQTIPFIFNNIISAMHTLLEFSPKYGPVSPANQASANFILHANDTVLDETTGRHLAILWKDPGIQQTYTHRSKFQLFDSAQYFFSDISRIATASYVPTEQDLLRCRIRTTGIVETSFSIEGNDFKMWDVGGQRNERKKWIHCFENVTAVLFVVALSEYDQNLYEDENTNRMTEALNLFEDVVNSKWFAETAIMLFLNKRDLFEEKLPRVPITECLAFQQYKGPPTDVHQSQNFIRSCFENLNATTKQVYTHITCATDKDNVQTLFHVVKDIIIRKSLGDAGMA